MNRSTSARLALILVAVLAAVAACPARCFATLPPVAAAGDCHDQVPKTTPERGGCCFAAAVSANTSTEVAPALVVVGIAPPRAGAASIDLPDPMRRRAPFRQNSPPPFLLHRSLRI